MITETIGSVPTDARETQHITVAILREGEGRVKVGLTMPDGTTWPLGANASATIASLLGVADIKAREAQAMIDDTHARMRRLGIDPRLP